MNRIRSTGLGSAPRPGKIAASLWDYEWPSAIPQLLIHVAAALGLWMGASPKVWILCIALYWLRMFAVTAGYHRYFSHRTYKTSRWFQFLLALAAMSSSQRGVAWWASHHRDHHRHSDSLYDVHSPSRTGFLHSHILWLYDRNQTTDWTNVKDLAKFPELVVLDRLWFLPPALLAVGCYLVAGVPGLLIGFCLSTVLLWHLTFTVNSLNHVWGSVRYETGDTSRNNWVLAFFTLGEGWHNNHHYFMNSTRQGFYWWEFDVTYWALLGLRRVGLVWDLKEPPARVYRSGEQDHRGRVAKTTSASPDSPYSA